MRNETRPIDKSRARDLLHYYWVNGIVVPKGVLAQIDAVSLPGETALAAVSRIAEVRTSDIQAFDSITLRRRLLDTQLQEELRSSRGG